MGTVTDTVGGLTDKLEDIAGGGPIGKAAAEGGKAKAEGGSAVGGALKGAVVRRQGQDHRRWRWQGGGGGKATKSTNIIETSTSACRSRSPTTSGPSSATSRAS